MIQKLLNSFRSECRTCACCDYLSLVIYMTQSSPKYHYGFPENKCCLNAMNPIIN